MFAVVKLVEDGLLIDAAGSLVSICSFDPGDDFPIGHKLYELVHGEWMGNLNTDERDEDTENSFPNVLPGRTSVSQLSME
jgi:hypothetical protein